MAIDTPARLAILGAGPMGLEAALYARFLGYDVVVYERGEVAETVRERGNERLLTPFVSSRSTLGLAAIQAQDENYQPPSDEALLTGNEWRKRYLLPLSQTDLISDHLRLHTTVLTLSQDENGDWLVNSRDASGQQRVEKFDGVLDCTGAGASEFVPEQQPQAYYHVLGSKSGGRDNSFQFADGLDQIRETFAIVGDRATLNLYAGATRLLR